MAPTSPSAVLAVSERPFPERPEAKSADGSDGQFAGLMAQFNHPPQPPPKAPLSSPDRHAKLDRAPKAKPPEDKPMARATSTAPDKPSSRTEPSPKADPTSKADPTPKAEPGDANTQRTEVQADASDATPDPTSSSTGLPAVPPTATGQEGITEDLFKGSITALLGAAQAASVSSSHAAEAKPSGANPATPGLSQAMSPMAKSLDPQQPGPIAIQLAPAAATVTPKEEPTTALPPAPLPPAAPIEPNLEPINQSDSAHLAPAAQAQAALAGSGIEAKDTSKSDAKIVLGATPKTDPMNLTDQGVKPLDDTAFARPTTPNVNLAPQAVTLPVNERELTFATSKAMAKTSLDPEVALPNAEALAAKTNLNVVAPSAHTPDGSALAALGTLSRIQPESVQTVTAPPPPPNTPPTAPVLQVEGGLRWMLKGGVQEAQLQLHPDSLGQVTIHLRVEGGEVHARLWVTEPGSVQAVQEGRPHLEQSLREQGLQLGSFDLHQGHRPFQEAPSTPTFREPTTAEATLTRQEAPLPPQPSILNPHHVELYA